MPPRHLLLRLRACAASTPSLQLLQFVEVIDTSNERPRMNLFISAAGKILPFATGTSSTFYADEDQAAAKVHPTLTLTLTLTLTTLEHANTNPEHRPTLSPAASHAHGRMLTLTLTATPQTACTGPSDAQGAAAAQGDG